MNDNRLYLYYKANEKKIHLGNFSTFSEIFNCVILTVSIILVVIITMEIWSFVAIILGGKANENY